MSKPASIQIDGQRYVPKVFKVDSLDEKARPESLTVIHEEQNIELAGGEWFIVGYVLDSTMKENAAEDCGIESSRGLGSPKKSVL